ncbi:MAG: leucine--tRNA ligase [Proteobacteria bacterium]|nr:MAG: leucine--tRNA ligase [Pseudomonadota bacterium]
MESAYNPDQIEREVQAYWEENASFKVVEDPNREKYYCLCMFPYPSGKLHMGHVRNYTIGDVISRHQRMLGKNVLQPMGWDAFGLPAENAAMQNNVPPAKWTYQNIDYMKGQLKRLGFAYDWSRELATCSPDYYRWEQWLFTRLYKKGLAYKALAEVNWDPVEQTVLANEQVIDGRGWRSGALVERRKIPHWFLRITEYAEELLGALDELDGWPESVKTMQRNWIGRSVGLEVDFPLADGGEPLRIFTTRPDTIFGATFMAVSADHPLAEQAAAADPAVAAFVEECRQGAFREADIETMEKKGLPLGIDALNPYNGERIPVWVANFVLMGYGTGAIMAVPAHDERDHAFATRFGLPIRQVIAPAAGTEVDVVKEAWTSKEAAVTVNSGEYSGLPFLDAFEKIADHAEREGFGARRVNYRLRDWGVSRQRYWGCPVPMIEGADGEPVPVPDDELPVVLPENVEVHGGGSPLGRIEDFVNAVDPDTGEPARRDTDTFDTFVESSWYYARFACADNDAAMLDERANYWLPVDQYIGGIEHAILHLLYARFFHKLMRDEGMVESNEPFTNLLTQGMVLAETYYREGDSGKKIYFSPDDVDIERDAQGRVSSATLRADGGPVEVGRMESMSKSKKNGVDPQTMIERYGADTVRLFMMFAAPPEQSLEWNDNAVAGAHRFLRRYWELVQRHAATLRPVYAADPDGAGARKVTDESCRALRSELYAVLDKAQRDFGRFQFNTVVAGCMEIVNALERFDGRKPLAQDHPARADRIATLAEALSILTRVLAPIVPHVTHAAWQSLGFSGALLDAAWPEIDAGALVRDRIKLVVQVNGKRRAEIEVDNGAERGAIVEAAMADESVARHVDGREPKKTVVVPGRLVNIVV